MRRRPALAPALALLAAAGILLAGCADGQSTTTAPPSPDATAGGGLLPTTDPAADPGAGLPDCDAVAEAAGPLLDGLAFDERFSSVELPVEDYAQRLCVFSTDDESAQIGITIATVALLPTEVELYSTMPGVMPDDRLVDGQVLQRTSITDEPTGALTGSLSLFDSTVTVTVQGSAPQGSIAEALPGLTMPAATDALFGVRAILP